MTLGDALRAGAWAVGGAAVARVVGLAWVDAVLVGLAVLVIALVARALPTGRAWRAAQARNAWPAATDGELAGVRREVAALTWTFTGVRGHISESAIRRLRADATRRLARRGLVVPGGIGPASTASPEELAAARELLGERTWALLTSPGGRLAPLDHVAHAVDVLDRLLPAPVDRSTEGHRP
jgi:hypothetical protein